MQLKVPPIWPQEAVSYSPRCERASGAGVTSVRVTRRSVFSNKHYPSILKRPTNIHETGYIRTLQLFSLSLFQPELRLCTCLLFA